MQGVNKKAQRAAAAIVIDPLLNICCPAHEYLNNERVQAFRRFKNISLANINPRNTHRTVEPFSLEIPLAEIEQMIDEVCQQARKWEARLRQMLPAESSAVSKEKAPVKATPEEMRANLQKAIAQGAIVRAIGLLAQGTPLAKNEHDRLLQLAKAPTVSPIRREELQMMLDEQVRSAPTP
jgi:hypothetical protein